MLQYRLNIIKGHTHTPATGHTINLLFPLPQSNPDRVRSPHLRRGKRSISITLLVDRPLNRVNDIPEVAGVFDLAFVPLLNAERLSWSFYLDNREPGIFIAPYPFTGIGRTKRGRYNHATYRSLSYWSFPATARWW